MILLAFDGATLDVISPAVAEGRLPNLGRIFDGGAVLHLATLRPTQAEPVWSAAATGKLPGANGIRASALHRVRAGDPGLELLPDYCFAQALVRFGFLHEEPHTASSLQARPLWSILSDSALSVGVIGFPLTHPAPPVNGYLVSDEFHRLSESVRAWRAKAPCRRPPRSWMSATRSTSRRRPNPEALFSSAAERTQGADARPDPAPVVGDRMHSADHASAADASCRRSFSPCGSRASTPSATTICAMPTRRRLATCRRRRCAQYGRVLSDYYGFVDAVVGRALESLGPDDLLLVVSAVRHGAAEPRASGCWSSSSAIPGSAARTNARRMGSCWPTDRPSPPGRPARASLLDLAPTILYYLGLPVGRDMDGFARTDLFRPAFTASRPVTFIPTYGR